MKIVFAPLLGCALALLATAKPAEPFRRPISSGGASGWRQVQLDAAAQNAIAGTWIADEEGRPVPFLRERDLPARSIELVIQGLQGGRDASGHVLVEFSVAGKAGETIVTRPESRLLGYGALGFREVWPTMVFAFEIEAATPWVAEAEIARRLPSGEWGTRDERVQLYDFGGGFRRVEFSVPRESAAWRVRLKGIQGEIRTVRHVAARVPAAATATREFKSALLGVSRRQEGWTLTLADGPRRVHGVELKLKGVVAPVRAEVLALDDDDPHGRETLVHGGSAQIWRMPGLNSSEGEVRFATPLVSERFRVLVPEGVELDETATALVREESLWFVAEQGHDYFVHFASERKPAAGNLADLPARLGEPPPTVSFLGPVQADPFGRPVREDVSVVGKRWLPWVVGVAVALLAVVALRMLRKPAA